MLPERLLVPDVLLRPEDREEGRALPKEDEEEVAAEEGEVLRPASRLVRV